MPVEAVTFENSTGQTLAGHLHTPPAAARAFALFAHCFTCTANIKAAVHIAEALTDHGIGVLRFDFTGLGRSEGEFADTNFSSNVEDLVAAADWLAAHHGDARLLVGHSLGGTAALAAAPHITHCRAVATIGSPASADHVLHLLDESRDEIHRSGAATVQLAGRPFLIKEQFITDVAEQALPAGLNRLGKALLVMHAPLDELVSIDNASQIFGNAKHPKSFISLHGADHLLSREADARYAGAALAVWASRYVDDAADHESPSNLSDAVVASTGAQGFLTHVSAAGHALLVDEPAGVGGTDQGPSPYELLSAALASCTSMTLQMYARHKKLPLENATVEVSHSRIHAEDCEHCESTTGRIDRFERVITLTGNLDDAVRQRMLEIADRCPVHRTLTGEIAVVTRLQPPGINRR